MRIGIRSAISALVLTSILVSAVGVHLLWWRTAQRISQTLANTINDQIVSAVGDELQSITIEARSSMTAVRTLLTEKALRQTGEPVSYGSGQIFSLAEGELHDEWIEADGADVLVGRKFSEVRS